MKLIEFLLNITKVSFRNLFKYILLIFLTSISLNANVNDNIHIGLSIFKSDEISQSKIKSVINRFISEINKNYDEKIYVKIIDNEKELIKEFEEFKNINVMITYLSVYLKNLEKIKGNARSVNIYSDTSDFIQYYLIANKKSKIKSIKDIKNKRFAIFKDRDNYTIWLDYLTRKNLKISYKQLVSKEDNVSKESSLVLNTYFNKSDFTVVSKKVFEDMLSLNPSLGKELVILKKSKRIFMDMMGFVNVNTSERVANRINEIFHTEGFHEKFDYMFNLVDKTTFSKKISFKELEGLDNFCNEYKKLKKN